MADLKELKLTDDEKREEFGLRAGEPLPEYATDYGYGLTLRLGTREMKKLGISGMQAGVEVVLTARARVTEVGSTERNGEVRESMQLTIEAMDIPTRSVPAASSLYGEG